MTILSVVNDVCDVVSLDTFASVYGSSNPAAQTMLELAKLGGEEIARRFDWKALERSFTATLTPYPMPSDYARLIDGGAVMAATGNFFRPVKTPSQWAIIKAVPSAQPYFYLSASAIALSPAASAPGTVITYVTKNWIKGNTGTEKSDFSADDDIVVFPENLLVLDLIWRWRRKQRLNFDDELAEFEAALSAATQEDRGK